MPVVPLRQFEEPEIIPPEDHAQPATLGDVAAAARYSYTLNNMFLHQSQGITYNDLASAHLHLQDTCGQHKTATNQEEPDNEEEPENKEEQKNEEEDNQPQWLIFSK